MLELMNSEFAALFKLGRAERLQLVEDLWDSIVNEEVEADNETAVPNWKRDELRQRKARLASHPESARTWEQVKDRARSQHD
jgi:putative addiction module component (TIGR02574 family)